MCIYMYHNGMQLCIKLKFRFCHAHPSADYNGMRLKYTQLLNWNLPTSKNMKWIFDQYINTNICKYTKYVYTANKI